jgi:hypothetical protein
MSHQLTLPAVILLVMLRCLSASITAPRRDSLRWRSSARRFWRWWDSCLADPNFQTEHYALLTELTPNRAGLVVGGFHLDAFPDGGASSMCLNLGATISASRLVRACPTIGTGAPLAVTPSMAYPGCTAAVAQEARQPVCLYARPSYRRGRPCQQPQGLNRAKLLKGAAPGLRKATIASAPAAAPNVNEREGAARGNPPGSVRGSL